MQIDEIRSADVLSNPFVAGAAGALLGLRSMSGATWRERLFNLLVGMVCAGYGAPALVEWLQMSSPRMQSFLAFGFGAFGVSVYLALADAIRRVDWGQVLLNLVEGVTNGRRGDGGK